ncbi:hypothetical protein [Reinekea sp.]|jgi:protein-L-isoaspartate O-methyltransferase|uniref:hypothetical protein n=2 Tax=Reinekea sp. TaxID=1970455 RepID=UPI00398979CB
MPHKNDNQLLEELTSTILNKQSSNQQLTEALDNFLLLCSHASPILPSLSFNAHAGDTELKQGVAINPEAAAQCVKDYQRTVAFIRGLYAAIQSKLEVKPEQTIRLLYAGCGPYAAILLPLLSILDTTHLDVHLLDIHEESLLSAQQLIIHFGFEDITIRYHCENACEFSQSIDFDIILTETMQKALEQEPQVIVTSNLGSQLKPQGIFLPEQIDITLCLRDKKSHAALFPVRNIFKLTASLECINPIQQTLHCDEVKVSLGTVVIPEQFNPLNNELVLSTSINIYNDIHLYENDSEITLTTQAYDLQGANAGEHWLVSYHLGSYPRIGFNLKNIQ